MVEHPAPVIDLSNVKLFSVELRRDIPVEQSANKSFFINFVIKRSTTPARFHMVFVDSIIGMTGDDGAHGTELYISYKMEFLSSEKIIISDDLLVSTSRLAIWQKVTDLFTLIIGSSDISFPELPPLPPAHHFVDFPSSEPEEGSHASEKAA